MNSHRYLRAFLAGIFVPTLILPCLLAFFIVVRLALEAPYPIERGLVFPMALVPAVWGLWNMLWEWSRPATRLPLGVHGAILPLLLLPAGTLIATHLGVLNLGVSGAVWFQEIHIPYWLIAACFCAALAAYYLVWKYMVGFLNRMLGIA
jgi:hypothetical protein